MKMYFSFLCIVFTCFANGEIFQTDTFTAWFPSPPKVKEHTYTATDTASVAVTVYTVIYRKSKETIDPLTLFEEILIGSAGWPNVLVEYQLSDIEGNPVLDFVTQNSINGVIQRERVIVYQHDIYILRTVGSMMSVQNHEYFIGSFQITD